MWELAAITGAILLLMAMQAKPLPTEKDAEAALKKLATAPDDPEANTVMTRYMAFVKGDWTAAAMYAPKGKDKTLAALIVEEGAMPAAPSGTEMGGMADKWLKGGDQAGALKPYFRDRAVDWYGKAWETVPDDFYKIGLRPRLAALQTLAGAARDSRSGKLTGWNITGGGDIGLKYAKDGRQSIRLANTAKTGTSQLQSDVQVPQPGKDFELSFWALTDGTDGVNDNLAMTAHDAAGTLLYEDHTAVGKDLPFWKKYVKKGTFPKTAARFSLLFVMSSTAGNVWIDGISVKVDGKELVKNWSFEQ